jgi:hypothetical protein
VSAAALPTAGLIVGMGSAAVVIGRASWAGLLATIGSRWQTSRRINRLACGMTLSYVESLFGVAALARAQPEVNLTEHVFYTPHAFVQVLIDADDVVVRFSITVTDDRFRFRTRDLTFDLVQLRLGKSRFASLDRLPSDGYQVSLGARRFSYVEAHSFGNPGAYQQYLLAYNDSGIGTHAIGLVHQLGLIGQRSGVFADDGSATAGGSAHVAQLDEFRQKTVVNTLTVVAGLARPDLCKIMSAGVDMDHVRVFRPSGSQRRRQRRRGRKIMRQLKRVQAKRRETSTSP